MSLIECLTRAGQEDMAHGDGRYRGFHRDALCAMRKSALENQAESTQTTITEADTMPFDPSKDKMLKSWKCDETGLIISINQYGDGEPKVQIGPRILLKKDGSERAPVKAGRLTIEDIMWLYEIIDEVKDELSGRVEPE
jgi:hypothetical protein